MWKRSFQVKLKLHFLYLNSSKYDKPKINPILKFFYTSTNCSHKMGFFGFLGLKVYEVIKLNMLITNSTRMRILRHTIQRLKLTLFDAHPLCPPCAKFYKKRQRVWKFSFASWKHSESHLFHLFLLQLYLQLFPQNIFQRKMYLMLIARSWIQIGHIMHLSIDI